MTFPFISHQRPLPCMVAAVCVAICTLSAVNCATRKATALPTEKAATTARSVDFLVKKLRERNVANVKNFQTQAKLVTEVNGSPLNATATLVWVRDEAVWIAIRKFGLEAVRALITPDSIKVLNRLEKTYSVRSVAALSKEYNLPGGFDLIQRTLLGQAWLVPDMQLQADIKDEKHRLYGKLREVTADYQMAEGSFLLHKEMFGQLSEGRTMAVGFENYQNVPDLGVFPMRRVLDAFSPETNQTRLELDFTNMEVNGTPSLRFEIPSHYRRL